jgi:hypothetical protein
MKIDAIGLRDQDRERNPFPRRANGFSGNFFNLPPGN